MEKKKLINILKTISVYSCGEENAKVVFFIIFLIGVSFSFFEIRTKEYDYLICVDPGHSVCFSVNIM